MDELNQLRDQMASMKSSLDKYSIVNKTLMRTVMRQRSNWLNGIVIAEIITVPILSEFFFGLCAACDLSIWIAITLAVALVASTVVDWKSTMWISSDAINSESLLSLRRRLEKQKHARLIQLVIELPLMLIWALWFYVEFFHMHDVVAGLTSGNADVIAKLIIIAIAFATSVAVVMWIYKRAQRTNDSMISDIDVLTEDE